MTVVRRSAGRAARQLRRPFQATRQQRRFESHDSHGSSSSSSSSHHPSAPANEGLGLKFWVGLGIFPASYVVYNASRPVDDGSGKLTGLSQRISAWTASAKESAERRNTSHTRAIEQAAADRHLFNGSEGSKKIDLGFPEVFNVGSPINVPAGHYTNLDKVIEHYKKENAAQAAKTQARLDAGRQLD